MNFAIVGCGAIAHRHAALIQKLGTLAAVCDNHPEKANAFAEQYNAKAYNDWKELLQQEALDVAVICSPNGFHAEHSIAALNAGNHVLCEKPMAIHVFDCARMLEASVLSNKKLFVVKQNRFNPPVAAVKQLVEEGVLGKMYSFQLNCFWNRNEHYYDSLWKGTLDLDGGILYTQFSHFIDLVYWLCGDVKSVNAISKNRNHQSIQFEDAIVATLEMENDVIGSVNATINSYNKNMEGSLTLFCEKGTVKIGGEYLNTIEYQNIDNYTISELPQSNAANNYGTYTGSMSNHDKVYDYMINVIENAQEQLTNAYDSMKTVEIIEKIYASARGMVI